MFNYSKWCYWSVADGSHGEMMAGCIKSARAVGVKEDFHIWSDKDIPGAIVHKIGNYDKKNYLFKLRFLKDEVSKLDYDWFVFLDADNYFVRHPGNLPEQLCKNDPLHVTLESPTMVKNVVRKDWWGIPLEEYNKKLIQHGVKTHLLFNTNAGFFIVHKSIISQMCNLAMKFWESCQSSGYSETTEEPPLAYVGHLLVSKTDTHTLQATSSIWASDWKGVWSDKFPDGSEWDFTDYMLGIKFKINPSIVHVMRAKQLLIEYGKQRQTSVEPIKNSEHIVKRCNIPPPPIKLPKTETIVEKKLYQQPIGDRKVDYIDYGIKHDFFIGHQMLGDVIGFAAAAHLYANKIGETVRIWFDANIGNRKDITKWFDGIEWVEKEKLVNPIDCGINPLLEDWPKFNGVKRFYQWMDPTMTPKKSFDIHFNKEKIINDGKIIGLITHSNTQGDIDKEILDKMLSHAKAQYPLHKIVLFGNKDNTVIPPGVLDWRQDKGDINWIIETVRRMDLIITPQTGPCFIAAGFRIPMWVYKSKQEFWDYTLNYDNYKIQRWYNRPMSDEEKLKAIKKISEQRGYQDILNLI